MTQLPDDNKPSLGPRYFVFLVFALAIVFANMAIMSRLNPRPEDQPPAVAEEDQLGNAEADSGSAVDADEGGAPEEPSAIEQVGAQEEPEPIEPLDQVDEEFSEPPQQLVTLGSLAADDQYRMLVTLTNQGAAVVRTEFSSSKYLDLEDRSGYLGHLGGADDVRGNGYRIAVVGPGTPAAEAGLVPGDVIREVDGQQVTGRVSLDGILRKTSPGDTIDIVFDRDGKSHTVQARLRRKPLSVIRPEGSDPLSFLLTLERLDDQSLTALRESLGEVAGSKEKVRRDNEEVILPPADLGIELEGVALRRANWFILDRDSDPANPATWPRESQAFDPKPRDHVRFAAVIPDANLVVIKTYRLASVPDGQKQNHDHDDYHLRLDVAVLNVDDQPHEVAYQLDGPTGLPIEGFWYARKMSNSWGSVGLRDVAVRLQQNTPRLISCQSIVEDDWGLPWKDDTDQLTAIGVDAQYFSAVLLPQKQRIADEWFAEARPIQVGPAEEDLIHITDTSCRLTSVTVPLAPGESLEHEYQVFIGPKRQDLLAAYDLGGLVQYGWFWWVAEPMTRVLHFFHDYFVFNYGLAIILLTVVVRGCMFPISRKQTLNMLKQRELQPEIQKIREKYKDAEQQHRAMRELWREHNFNPFSGCLVMFIQIPIFFGLYKALAIDVELRQSPLFTDAIRWCSNLSAPDMLFDWSFLWPEWFNQGQGIFGLGPYFNLLPVLTVVIFLWQQKAMMPPAADEQAAMQQKVMSFMMIFMGVLFYKIASGLCLYFIASSMWGMAERKLLPKAVHADRPAKDKPKPAPQTGKKAAKSRSSQWLDKFTSGNGEKPSGKARRKKARRRR